MIGKKMRVSELEFKYGTRPSNIKAYACFKNKQFNTNIIIYSLDNDNNFYYGNAHLNNDKIIIMKLSINKDELVLKFINDFLEDKLDEYEIIDIQNKTSVEIISYNELKVENDIVVKLENKTIKVEEKIVDKKKKKSGFKLILIYLFIFIIMILGFYVYFNREKIFIKNSKFQCVLNYKHDELDVDVEEVRTLIFQNNKLENIDIVVDFKFEKMEDYQDVKLNNKQYVYSVYGTGTFKYVDDSLMLRMFYNNFVDKELENDDDKIIESYKIKGYECKEIEIEVE